MATELPVIEARFVELTREEVQISTVLDHLEVSITKLTQQKLILVNKLLQIQGGKIELTKLLPESASVLQPMPPAPSPE